MDSAAYTQQNYPTTPGGRSNRKFFIVPNDLFAIIIYDEVKSNHIIRYAEVLLLYAETLNENGKSGEALTQLNQVQTRARNTPSADPQRTITVYG